MELITYFMNILIRECRRTDAKDILNICYKTGYMGEELTDKNIFNDTKLFGYLFCSYYYMYERENCFVAVNIEENKVVGYIIGTLDSKKQEKQFVIKMIPKIFARLMSYTIWKHTESYSIVKFFIKNINSYNMSKILYKKYPAHFHINILPEYQKSGMGSKLLNTFENHAKEKGMKGIHLRTSNKNIKAIPFYMKNRYHIIYESEGEIWPGIAEGKNLIFGKEIIEVEL